MSFATLALPLLMLLAPPDEAAQSPEALWALLTDPSTSYDDRMLAAERAKDVLPPRYLSKQIAIQVEFQDRQIATMDVEPVTIEERREAPWRWQLAQALKRVDIPIGSANAMDVVGDLPCTTQREEWVIERTLRRFPMTAETYGVIRNMVAPRPEYFMEMELPEDFTYREGDDFFAAQVLIADLASSYVPAGWFTTEIRPITSPTLYSLENMLLSMRSPFPYTAFLALADRIEKAADENQLGRLLAYDAARLVQVLDDPPIEAVPPQFADRNACAAWLEEFHQWMQSNEGKLAAGAAQEQAAIDAARARMNRVTLCRH
ncbi:MAG: hypothetical protein QOH21_2957 [Acidobacteriota bacterium]|jgi:hypothetical protein|nr:hypothetical protein [Acidobacteriota bacterium]